jgi:hypothetical protein
MPVRNVIVLLPILLAGCSLFGGDDGEIEIQTDARSYVAEPDASVLLTVSNETDKPVYFLCTGQVFLEELDGDQVNSRWMIHGFEECLSPVPIDADSEYTFELSFDEKSALGNLNDAVFDDTVEYRMSVDLYRDRAFNRPVAAGDSRSNRFTVVRNPVL